MPRLPELASRLRQLRQRHNLTQEQFAEIAGLSYKFYQQIEAGRKKQIWLETVERLAAGFGLETWQLLAPKMPTHTVVSRPGDPSVAEYPSETSSPAVAESPEPFTAENPSRASRKRATKRKTSPKRRTRN